MAINNFWNMVEEMNDIHSELWNNRDIAVQDEPDAGTLEILANCEAIEAIEAENQLQVELQNEIEQAKDDIMNRIVEMIEFIPAKEIAKLVKNELLNPGSLDSYIAEKVQEEVGYIIPQDTDIDDMYFMDDMDEIDRRNMERMMDARLAL